MHSYLETKQTQHLMNSWSWALVVGVGSTIILSPAFNDDFFVVQSKFQFVVLLFRLIFGFLIPICFVFEAARILNEAGIGPLDILALFLSELRQSLQARFDYHSRGAEAKTIRSRQGDTIKASSLQNGHHTPH